MTDTNPFQSQPQVSVFLGAHKTATTYIQRAMDNRRDELAGHGVHLYLPGDIRGKIGLRLPSPRFSEEENRRRCADTAEKITKMIAESPGSETMKRIVLSEENLIGSCKNNLVEQALYPDMSFRLSLLPRWLNRENVTFYFSVRSYPTFYSSNLTTVLRSGTVFDRSELAKKLLGSQRGWQDVVSDITSHFPKAALRLWRYEDFSYLESRLFEQLVGIRIASESTARPNSTLSQEAVAWTERKLALRSTQKPGKIARRASTHFPVGAGRQAFSLWDEKDKAELHERYLSDWNLILQNWPGCEVQTQG